MVMLGFSLAMMMGLTLGLIGAGGSILTVPILVYFLKVKPIVATGYSLLVVGSAALFASMSYWRRGAISFHAMIMFALPAMFSVLLTRTFLIPSMPDFIWGMPKDHFIMLLFAMMMIMAAVFMFRPFPEPQTLARDRNLRYYLRILIGSMSVGVLSGLVGAGGGFLIIPCLIAFFDLDLKSAIGTSLAIIAINSLIGFNGDIHAGIVFNWSLLSIFLICTFVGISIGVYIGKHLSAMCLKKIFAYFILLVSLLILIQEIYELIQVNPGMFSWGR